MVFSGNQPDESKKIKTLIAVADGQAKKMRMNARTLNDSIFEAPILIVGDTQFNAAHVCAHISKVGFENISFATSIEAAKKTFLPSDVALLLVFARSTSNTEETLEFLRSIRLQGYRGSVAVVMDALSVSVLLGFLSVGINDLFLQGPHLDITAEVACLLNRHRSFVVDRAAINPNSIKTVGFFRTLGLTQKEVEVLSKYACCYPRYDELSFRTGKTPVQVRKCFCSIFDKLSATLGVDNPSRLAQFLTLCSIYW